MITVYTGNIGSGKTLSAVREMSLEKRRKIYTNIKTKLKHCKLISPEMIIKKDMVKTIKKRDGSGTLEPVYEYKLNKDYWQGIKEPISVVLDEIHSIMDSRRAMSKTNKILNDWLSLLRRVLGQSEAGYGELVLITQLSRRLDVIAREMAHQIRYHVCYYKKRCRKCGCTWQENSEMPEPLEDCPRCVSWNIYKLSHVIYVYCFDSMEKFNFYRDTGTKTFYKCYYFPAEKYFKLYDTLQWDNLFDDYY